MRMFSIAGRSRLAVMIVSLLLPQVGQACGTQRIDGAVAAKSGIPATIALQRPATRLT